MQDCRVAHRDWIPTHRPFLPLFTSIKTDNEKLEMAKLESDPAETEAKVRVAVEETLVGIVLDKVSPTPRAPIVLRPNEYRNPSAEKLEKHPYALAYWRYKSCG